jgi:hypothetical protein
MQSLEKKDVVVPIRVISPVKIALPNKEWAVNPQLKAVVQGDTLIQVLDRHTKIISDERVWDTIIPILERRHIPFIVDPVNTSVIPTRLMMHIVFIDTHMWDGQSKISLSLWVYNSYDKYFAFKWRFGTYRWTDSSASYAGWKLLKATHYRGDSKKSSLAKQHFESALTYALKLYPAMQQKINELRQQQPTEPFKQAMIKAMPYKFGKIWRDDNLEEKVITAYDLYTELTRFISHYAYDHLKPFLYKKVSEVFEL